MRPSTRLLAVVRPAARYLEPGAPTGLTGLRANPSPRATLLYLYSTTLAKLQPIPETSVYRQSVEAVTKNRMAAVQAVKPEGYDEWQARAAENLKTKPDDREQRMAALQAEKPKGFDEWQARGAELTKDGADNAEAFNAWMAAKPKGYDEWLERAAVIQSSRPDSFNGPTKDGSVVEKVQQAGATFVIHQKAPKIDERYQEWDGDGDRWLTADAVEKMRKTYKSWEDEPQLTIAQIEELENKIGAGLIEEVIQVAEGELQLVDTMVQGKVWESLDERPAEGQWTYFERKS